MPRGEKTGTLYDYPTYTLKNLAKEYNIHYYIKDIERLSKADLVEAILAHVEWLKTPETVKNKVDFEKSLADAPTNFEKDESGFFKGSPGRRNIKQIEKEIEKKTEKPPTPPSPPAYKGQKGVSKKVATLVEAVVKEQTSQAKLLAAYHELSAADQANFRDVIGIEAKPLPKGVPALGEADVSDKQIAIAINEYQEENAPGIVQLQEPATLRAKTEPSVSQAVLDNRKRLIAAVAAKNPGGPAAAYKKATEEEGYTGTFATFQKQFNEKKAEPTVVPPPKRTIVLKKPTPAAAEQPYPKLAELEAKAANDGPLSARRYLIALAKLLIANKKESQSTLGRKLAEMGFSGTTQSTISKKISYMKDIGLVKPYNAENGYYPLIA